MSSSDLHGRMAARDGSIGCPRSPKRKLGELSLSEKSEIESEPMMTPRMMTSPFTAAAPAAPSEVAVAAVTDDDDGGAASSLSDTDVEATTSTTSTTTSHSILRPPLRFVFKGWSIWLDVEAEGTPPGKFTDALAYAARRHAVQPIPAPHVTVIYGIDHIAEEAVRRRFRSLEASLSQLREGRNDTAVWPPLASKGVLSDIELEGVDGGTMTMAWSEVSLQTSELQERLVDHVWDVMMCGGSDEGGEEYTTTIICPTRPAPWLPHLSLCYDNPEGTPLNLVDALDVVAKHPFLLGGEGVRGGEGGRRQGHDQDQEGRRSSARKQLRLTGLSLWNTEGSMDEWRCVDRIAFPR